MLFSTISDEAEWSIHENFTTSKIIEVYVLNKTLTGKKTVRDAIGM